MVISYRGARMGHWARVGHRAGLSVQSRFSGKQKAGTVPFIRRGISYWIVGNDVQEVGIRMFERPHSWPGAWQVRQE